jgi:hypothetical protein
MSMVDVSQEEELDVAEDEPQVAIHIIKETNLSEIPNLTLVV